MSLSSGSARWLRRLSIALAAVVVLAVGLLFGGHPSWLPGPIRSVFVSESENQKVSQDVLGLISKDYYRPVNTNRLVNKGLEAVVQSLNDPYSHYYPPSLTRSFQDELTPQVTGIGVEIDPEQVKHAIEIEEVIQHSPAAKAGLRNGDLIVSVNGQAVAGMTVSKTSARIQGRAGTSVRLGIRRGKQMLTVNVIRRHIFVPVVASKVIERDGKKLGYLDLTQFSANSADAVESHLKKLLAQGVQGVILDLRDNGGGLVEQAVKIVSLFVAHGTVVTTRGRSIATTVYEVLGDAIAPKIPMVVLVDRGTASSAEITTGALKDHHRALVIGTRTYGKGVFQEIQPVTGGGLLDMTVGEYFTPNGHNLGAGGVKRGKGIKPNIYVYDNPNDPGSKAVKVAEKTLAGEIK